LFIGPNLINFAEIKKFEMKVAILVAMDKELSLLLSVMGDSNEVRIGKNVYYRGEIGGKEIIAGKCGIGKVNAALRTQLLLQEVAPDLVINSGVAGGASAKMKVGDILVADKVAYHDVWCGPGTVYGAADGYPQYFIPWNEAIEKSGKIESKVKKGLICSGDKFIHTADEVAEIRSHFPEVLAVDMESAAIAQTCVSEEIPFVIIRVMSDTPGEGDNIEQYKDFWGEAPKKTFECVEQLIMKL